MKSKFYLLFLAFIASCSANSGDSGPCGPGYSGYNYTKKYYGMASLDSNNKWLPDSLPLSIEFLNKNNTPFIYNVSPKVKKIYNIDIYGKYVSELCFHGNVYDYFTSEYETINYISQYSSSLNLSLNRYKNTSNADSLNISKLQDNFIVNICNKSFSLNPNIYTDFGEQKFLLKYKNYDSIFNVDRFQADSGFIVPQGFYYSKTKGIIGFYFTNHIEEWEIK